MPKQNQMQLKAGIDRLRKRAVEVQALVPAALPKYAPQIDVLQAALDDSLYRTFGGMTDRYNRYHRTIDWAASIPSVGGERDLAEYRDDIAKGREEVLAMLAGAIQMLEEELSEHDSTTYSGSNKAVGGAAIFIGHGRSPIWRELKDFLKDRLHLTTDEFNNVPTAGIATADRLSEMLARASFAFIVMTAEDEQPDGKKRARENVVHEVGLFQGRLGFKRAIILLEEGCEEFSNIHGLGQIRFPKGAVSAKFEEIRQVLERENQLK